MQRIDIWAFFRPENIPHAVGVSRFMAFAEQLRAIPSFAPGWAIDGTRLADDPDGFRTLAMAQPISEGPDAGPFKFALAESAAHTPGQPEQDNYYLMKHVFAEVDDGGHHMNLLIKAERPSFHDIRALISELTGFAPLLHVTVRDTFYAQHLSPVDWFEGQGLGWMGWVPFDLLDDEVPEAEAIETMGKGTFLASQIAAWDLDDPIAVDKAKALEARLLNLGALPKHADIRAGEWGE